MKYIKELREGENVIEHYLCKSRASMKSRNGKTYLSLKLQDKTGIVDAKVWDMNKDIQSFQENDFIKVDAFVTTFNNELQLNVKRIRRSREGEYDPADFIPSTDKNIDEMYTQLLAYIKTIQSPYIKKLLEEIFLRHPVISKDFKYHSAAKTMHHSFRGGLVEHTLSVTQICDFMAPRYEFVDRDILVACAMLHDIAHKAGTVNTGMRVIAACAVRAAHKLERIVHKILAGTGCLFCCPGCRFLGCCQFFFQLLCCLDFRSRSIVLVSHLFCRHFEYSRNRSLLDDLRLCMCNHRSLPHQTA